MRKIFKLTLAACLLSVLGACSQNMDDNDRDDGIPVINKIDLSNSELIATQGINEFAFNFMNKGAQNPDAFGSTQGNFTFSPLSVALALSMLANTADTETETAVSQILGEADLNAINSMCNKLMRFLPSRTTGGKIMLANAFWYDNTLKPLQSWKERMENVFYADTKGLSFASEGSADIINKWTAAKTEGLIDKVADSFDPDTKVYLINAMYVLGQWRYPFNREETSRKNFSGKESDAMVDMMHMERAFYYYANESFEMVRLGFDGSLNMSILLPAQGVETAELARKLTYEDFLTATWGSTTYTVDLSLPKFKVNMEIDLSNVLNALGLPTNCMLEKMGVEDGGAIRVRQLNSTSFDEEGAELAAVSTSDIVGASGEVYEENFVKLEFNRPFIYVVHESYTSSILLMGVVNKL